MNKSLRFFFLLFIVFLSAPAIVQAQSGWSWGLNDFGQLGDGGAVTWRNTPGEVLNMNDIVALSASNQVSFAIKSDGTVWGWGNNYASQLGCGTHENSYNTPVQTQITDVIAISGCTFLKSDGTVWISSDDPPYIPVLMPTVSGIKGISAGGNHWLFLRNDGTIHAEGNNVFGQLGDGTNNSGSTEVLTLTGVVQIAAGWNHSLALKSDGTVWAWGKNLNGQLGDGTNVNSNIPIQVSGLNNVTKVAAGGEYSLALTSGGEVWTWGYNGWGQLGNGSVTSSALPVNVLNLSNVVDIASSSGASHNLAMRNDGTVWAWGYNIEGELGSGSTNPYRSTPVPVANEDIEAAVFAVGVSHTLEAGWRRISISPSTLPNGLVGTAYDQAFSASGGTAPYTFAVVDGSLPPGLSLSSEGSLTGTPTTSGIYTFTVAAADSGSGRCNAQYMVIINNAGCGSIAVSPSSLPSGRSGEAYSQALTASGGTAPYTFALQDGVLPPGVTLASGGTLSGTPSTIGTYDFSVLATDAGSCMGGALYTITINAPCTSISVSPTSLPAGAIDEAYNQTISGIGGTPPYTYAVTSGALPAGLTLSPSGDLTGMPTESGSFEFTVTVTDSSACTGAQAYTLRITAPCPIISLTPSAIPNGTVGVAYSGTIAASGGASPYTFTLNAGVLPPGFILSQAGVISGTPSKPGEYYFSVLATDANLCTAVKDYSIVISCPVIAITPDSLPSGIAAEAYNQPLTVTGGHSPYTFTISGFFPEGLTLSSAGVISGYPFKPGTYNFTITATDKMGCSASNNYVVDIKNRAIIYSVFKATEPFRIIVKGTSFYPGAWIYVNGAPVPVTTHKSVVKVVAKGGEALKAMVPKGVAVEITVKNPDGTFSEPFVFVRQ